MSQRSTYKTKQRERLLDYLKTVKGTHITAADVCRYFKTQDSSMGQSTIYRQLEKLVDEGLLKKYIVDSNSPACFEYVEADSHVGESVCFHCKCEKCGKQCRRPGEAFDTHRRTLTVAHLNHNPADIRPENLCAMCAPCHLRYDAQHHAETRRRKKDADRAVLCRDTKIRA